MFRYLVFFLISNSLYSHMDFYIEESYDNVKVRIRTGYQYEEINKVLLIGELSEQLAKKLDYEDTIYLDFIHAYVIDEGLDYQVSFDKGGFIENKNISKLHNRFERDVIVIRQIGKHFDIEKTLKLVEYSITNKEIIESSQFEKETERSYGIFVKNKSISDEKVESILQESQSNELKEVLCQGVFRISINNLKKNNFTYYWENNVYYIMTQDTFKAIIALKSVYKILEFEEGLFIFDTDNTFCFLGKDEIGGDKEYKYVLSDCKKKSFEPIEISPIGDDNYLFTFVCYKEKREFEVEKKVFCKLEKELIDYWEE